MLQEERGTLFHFDHKLIWSQFGGKMWLGFFKKGFELQQVRGKWRKKKYKNMENEPCGAQSGWGPEETELKGDQI